MSKTTPASPELSDMSITRLTGAMLSLKESESTMPPEQLADSQKRMDEIEREREAKQPDGKFPLGKGTALHDMLTSNTPEEVTRIISSEKKRENPEESMSRFDTETLLKHAPSELVDKISEVGQIVSNQQSAANKRETKQTQQTILYFASEFVRAIDELSEAHVTNAQLKAVLSETPTLLVDAQCKSMIKTEQARQSEGALSKSASASQELPMKAHGTSESRGR
ncbi:MAG: hypothetical protein V4485_00375 [Pseudomonadota bacterium]